MRVSGLVTARKWPKYPQEYFWVNQERSAWDWASTFIPPVSAIVWADEKALRMGTLCS